MPTASGEQGSERFRLLRGLFPRLALLVLVPVALLAAAALNNADNEYAYAESAAIEEADAFAQRAAFRLDDYHGEAGLSLVAVAQIAHQVIERAIDGDRALARLLQSMPQHVTGLSIYSVDGRMLASSTNPGKARASLDVSDQRYFRAALEQRRVVVSAPVISRTTGHWIVISARPVIGADGVITGVVSVSTRVGHFHNVLVPKGLPLGALMTVFDAGGVGIASNAEPLAVVGRDLTGSATVRRAVRERGFAIRGAASDGEERFVAYAAGESLPWIVEVGLDADRTLAPARLRLKQRLWYLLAALLAGLAAAYVLARRIERPVHSLTRAAARIAAGDYSARVASGGYREVLHIGGSFNAMAEAIGANQHEIKASEERFRSLVLLSSDWYWTQDAEHRFTSHSQGRFGAAAFSADDVRGRTRWEMPGALPIGTTWEEHRALLAARKPWHDLVVRYTANDGTDQYISSSGEPAYDAAGEFSGYRGVARLVTDRYRLEAERAAAQEALRESEGRLRATLEYSPHVAVQWYDREGRVRFWNAASTAVFGWTAEEAAGRTLAELGLYTPAQFSDFVAALRAIDRDGPRARPAESPFLRKDGTQGVIVSSLFPIASPAGGQLYACTDVDVTPRVELEKALRERMELFRVTLDTPAVCVALIRRRDNLALLTNRATNDTFDVDLAKADWDVTRHWERKADLVEMLTRVQRDGHVRDMEVPVHIPGRGRMWAQLSAHPARYQDEDVLVVTLNDITARKALEEARLAALAALRVSEAKFRALTRLSSDWYWEQDASLNFIHMDADGPGEANSRTGRMRKVLRAVPASDTWKACRARQLRRETFRDVLIDYPAGDGTIHHALISAEPVLDDAGVFCGYRGTGTDVTRRIRLEHEVQERVDLFQVTMDTTPVAIGLIRRHDNRVLLANRAAQQLFGIAEPALWDVMALWERPQDMREMLHRVRESGYARDMEVPLRVPGGGMVWTLLSAHPARYQGEAVMVVTLADITERRALQAQREALLGDLHGANERLRLLSRQVLDVQEAERRQIAHELHDEIGQSLSALKLFAGHLRGTLPQAAHAPLNEWIGIVDQTVAQVRDLSRLLRPVQLDHMGLAPALRGLLDTQARAAGWVTAFEVAGEGSHGDTRVETVCYRVVQEALNNAARHADAASVSVRLEQSEHEMRIHIEDDGRGFDLAAARAREREGASMGLLGMEERVRLAGGSFHIESAPARGTRIEAVMPIAVMA